MMRALVLAVVTGGLMLPTSVFAQQLWWLVEQTRVISNSTAWDVNDAGVAVGMIAYPNPTNLATEIRRAVRWSAATGLQILDSIAQSPSDEARAISANGQVIAGIIATPNGERGALWTGSEPEVLHAIRPNGYQAGVVALSARGDIPVGYSNADNTGVSMRFAGLETMLPGYCQRPSLQGVWLMAFPEMGQRLLGMQQRSTTPGASPFGGMRVHMTPSVRLEDHSAKRVLPLLMEVSLSAGLQTSPMLSVHFAGQQVEECTTSKQLVHTGVHTM
ncbi:MAG: hypothetical protein N2971_08575 [Chlorobi bacterium]|nr:hypothetical protein [Chlorobiota bacterium]